MSQIENISGLQSILEAVNALPEAGGGGGVETCTIHLKCTTSDIYGYSYLAYRDGAFVPVIVDGNAAAFKMDEQLEDVICGGHIVVYTKLTDSLCHAEITGSATYETHIWNSSINMVFTIYAQGEPGSISTVTIVDDD